MSTVRNFWRSARAAISTCTGWVDPTERVTFWVVAGLALALAFAIHRISSAGVSEGMLPPSVTAPPFELRFAAMVTGQGS